DIALALLDKGAKIDCRWMGRTPLIQATRYGYSEVVSRLLCLGADVNAQIYLDEIEREFLSEAALGYTALHYAALDGKDDLVDILLKHGAKTANTPPAWTPMNVAAKAGHFGVVTKLLAAGAEADASSLHLAAKYGHASVLRELLAAGASPDVCGKDLQGEGLYWSPLLSATAENHALAVRVLLEAGADVNFKWNGKINALKMAK
ncbi:unnamed protein product, partial [Phaeothamnion confervicola]